MKKRKIICDIKDLTLLPPKKGLKMGKLSRTKGHGFEREIAILFRQAGFVNAKRKLEYQIDECIGIDLENTGAYAIQCKRLKKYSSISAIEEITDKNKIPILITKADSKPILAVLPLDELLRVIQIANKYEPNNLEWDSNLNIFK